jgi:hypothetical protein
MYIIYIYISGFAISSPPSRGSYAHLSESDTCARMSCLTVRQWRTSSPVSWYPWHCCRGPHVAVSGCFFLLLYWTRSLRQLLNFFYLWPSGYCASWRGLCVSCWIFSTCDLRVTVLVTLGVVASWVQNKYGAAVSVAVSWSPLYFELWTRMQARMLSGWSASRRKSLLQFLF